LKFVFFLTMVHTTRTVDKNRLIYTENDIKNALNAVNNSSMKIREAARAFGVPKSTLADRVNGKKNKITSQTAFSEFTENLLVELIGHLSDIGFGLSKKLFLNLVEEYLIQTDQTHLFANGKPHPNFYFKFMNRHQEKIKTLKAQNISEIRAKSTSPEVFDEWFKKVKEIYDKYDLHDKPFNIYNCDESGFQPVQKDVRIITKTSTRNPYKLSANNPKCTFTVLFCCNANGEYLPPNFIFKGKNLYSHRCKDGPPRATYDTSDSGWMEGDNFFKWFKDVFVPSVKEKKGWKVLFFDGHHSHISSKLAVFALENFIILIVLPPNATHLIQPLDGQPFKKGKRFWQACLEDYLIETKQRTVLNNQFPKLMRRVFEKNAFDRITAIAAFEQCGIFPLDRSKIKIDKTNVSLTFTDSPLPTSTVYLKTTPVTPPTAALTPTNRIPLQARILNSITQATTSGTYASAMNCYEEVIKDFESVTKSHESISLALKNSVTEMFREKHKSKENGRNIKLKRNLSSILTEEESINQLKRFEAEKARKVQAAEEKNREKENKLRRLNHYGSTIDDVIQMSNDGHVFSLSNIDEEAVEEKDQDASEKDLVKRYLK